MIRTGNVDRTCKLIKFLSEFPKNILFFLWSIVCLKVGGNNEFESDKCSRLSFESENANSKYLVAIHIAECQAFGFMIQIAAHTEGPA